MDMDIEIKIECNECKKKIVDDWPYNIGIFICNECEEKLWNRIDFDKYIRELFEKIASNHDHSWLDKEMYIGWDTEKEKEIFMRGIRHGFFHALWAIAYELEDDELSDFVSNLDEKSNRIIISDVKC